MKTRKNIITVLTLCAALSLTACTGKETKDTTDTQTTDAASTPESSSEINDLFQQENQLFADHQDEWNKAFAMANKSSADPSGNYGDYLADLVDSNKDEFTEEELFVESKKKLQHWKAQEPQKQQLTLLMQIPHSRTSVLPTMTEIK